MKTAIEQAIEQIDNYEYVTKDMAIVILTELLEVERAQIEQAFDASGGYDDPRYGTDYYTTTFKNKGV